MINLKVPVYDLISVYKHLQKWISVNHLMFLKTLAEHFKSITNSSKNYSGNYSMDYIFFTSKLEQCSLLIIHVLDRSRDVLCWDVFLSFYILTLSSCRALKNSKGIFGHLKVL